MWIKSTSTRSRSTAKIDSCSKCEQELRSRHYRKFVDQQVRIPAGQPRKTRPLGIPTLKDRVVQMAVKIVIEPLFEADFYSMLIRIPPEEDDKDSAERDRRQR